MISSILAGIVAAFVVSLVRHLPMWQSPVAILGVAAAAVLLQRFVVDRKAGPRAYDGIADLLIHIHSPSTPDSSLRWFVRGAISFYLAVVGVFIGPEGAAIELAHAQLMRFRPRSARWFEQRRRSDVGTALAAGISATFCAPFAAILLPLELGIGGRTLSAVVAAFSAFITLRILSAFQWVSSAAPWNMGEGGVAYLPLFTSVKTWIIVGVVAVLMGAFGLFFTRFVRYCQESLLDLFQTQTWMRVLGGGILLCLVGLAYHPGFLTPAKSVAEVLSLGIGNERLAILICVETLGLALLISAFGTLGVFFPILAMGCTLGVLAGQLISPEGFPMGGFAGIIGAVSLWSAVFGAPLTGTVLIFEVTQRYELLVPCFLAALLAKQVRLMLKGRALFELDLEARGVSLKEGRATDILEGLWIRDALVGDHETVHEHEPVSELYGRLLKSKYPFLPVVTAQGIYLGLLTIDMVEEAWRHQSALSKVIEAKDLLLRLRHPSPTVQLSDRLSVTSGLFEDAPCVPVLGEDRRVAGLLFVHHVRLAYDREVARRSLSFENREA